MGLLWGFHSQEAVVPRPTLGAPPGPPAQGNGAGGTHGRAQGHHPACTESKGTAKASCLSGALTPPCFQPPSESTPLTKQHTALHLLPGLLKCFT